MAEAQKPDGSSDDQAANISGTLFEAGSDAISSTLYAFIQAMLLLPDVQKKAQRDEKPNLQYVRACMKENLCWRPTTIVSTMSHAVT